MAATMGFASFGRKPNPPKKKRKLEQEGEGSGSNSMPLGMRVRKGEDVRENGLGEGERVEVVDELVVNGELVVGKEAGEESRDDAMGGGGSYGAEVDGERNAVDSNRQYHTATDRPPDVGFEATFTENVAAVQQSPLSEPRISAQFPCTIVSGPGAGRKTNSNEWDWWALRKGVRDERGDMAFYDASFVEDPWRYLSIEQPKG